MGLILEVTVILALLFLWVLAWRHQTKLALGITLGMMLVWLLAATLGPLNMDKIPLWLPPLPFAIVAITLLCFGIWAWFRGDAHQDSGQAPEDHGHRDSHGKH